MTQMKCIVLASVILVAGIGWAADPSATFDSDPMGVNIEQVGYYEFHGHAQEWISGTASQHWLVHFTMYSGYVYEIRVNGTEMETDTFEDVDTGAYQTGSFDLAVTSVIEDVYIFGEPVGRDSDRGARRAGFE